jgi:hypothetical protein
LTQIVGQLPPQFERHLRQIKEAINNLSEDRARHALAGALQLELVDAPNVPATLKHLHESCLSPGFRRWLIRPGGVIDRIVRQLTQESDVSDRESLPTFTPDEFLPPSAFQDNNAPTTRELIEDLDFLPELREEAAVLFNSAARPAVKTMSGLIGSGLRDVFDAIRRELQGEGKRLALFVEDVSVMASLDEDILNAVEPNPDPELGQLMAIVGMTETGFRRLPENLVGRTTDIVAVGLDTASEWLANPRELSRFSARYLNVSRLTDDGVNIVAADRLRGTEIAHSACTACPLRESCHSTFGMVSFDGVDVGLFPFTENALHALFAGLNERMPAVRKNPRGLLEHILTPVLRDDRTALLDRAFPRAKLAVELEEPSYWSAFAAKYLGGWSPSEKSRLSRFAQGWVSARNEDGAAEKLQPFLIPLAFSSFTGAVTPGALNQLVAPPPPPTTEVGESEELRALRNEIGRWAEGEPLENDEVPRGLVLDLIKHAIAWDDEVVPVRVYDKLLKNKSYIRFEDQRSRLRAGQVFAFEIHRSEESRSMVEALARWKWEGRESWKFHGGQRHRRVAANWLRRNHALIIDSLVPGDPPGREPAMAHAVRVLAAVTMLRRASDHPPDRPGIVRELLRAQSNVRPPTINGDDENAINQLWTAYPKAREFLLGELSAPQGGTRGGTVFIDPRAILKYANSLHTTENAQPLDSFYSAGSPFWQASYASLEATSRIANLASLLDSRRNALLQLIVRDIRPALMDAQLSPDDLEPSITTYCEQVSALLPVQADSFPKAYPEMDARRTAFNAKGKAWAKALAAAERVVTGENVVGLLLVPIEEIREGVNGIITAHDYLRSLETELTASERRLVADGDPDVLLAELTEVVKEIAGLKIEIDLALPGRID